jgi:hypothetical protein
MFGCGTFPLLAAIAMPIETPEIEPEAGDPTAEFLELYSHNYPRLQYYLMSLLPTADDAADVLQETSLVLWRKFAAYETGTNFFAWYIIYFLTLFSRNFNLVTFENCTSQYMSYTCFKFI